MNAAQILTDMLREDIHEAKQKAEIEWDQELTELFWRKIESELQWFHDEVNNGITPRLFHNRLLSLQNPGDEEQFPYWEVDWQYIWDYLDVAICKYGSN